VELLSDIVTGDGKSIRRHIRKGRKDACHENFTKSFFEQPQPGETAWAIWRKILKTITDCNDYGTLTRRQFPIETSDDWIWFLDDRNDRMYKKIREGWDERSRILGQRRTRQQRYGTVRIVHQQPTNVLPITTYSDEETVKIDGKGRREPAPKTSEQTWYNTSQKSLREA
jgi:hypothetical protein